MADNKDYIIHSDNQGNINISTEVVAAVSASAALECEGVASLYAIGKDISGFFGKKNANRGVKVLLEEDSMTIDIYLSVKLGVEVNKVGAAVQAAVISAVEVMTGFTVKAVNVHVTGITLDK
ncbi:MAG: Asp23/Gls24 family envelope stress response protein [Ruminococcaceae bacterium]|nr:Asp23/Gls24 family envelope stress response protein [Oscillospiraceae bacterium]